MLRRSSSFQFQLGGMSGTWLYAFSRFHAFCLFIDNIKNCFQFYLTAFAMSCIGCAFIIAVGLCSLIGIPYGPVHSSLPFLIMALGVDDTFIMMSSWKQVLSVEKNREKPLEEKVALMLSHAGSAICITSLTDVVAFIIGASTVS